ncbi:hypothetical protein MICRO80W_210012 [Micrococcus luteus]|nr:hypothetical protein MICRO80W_210012 [Micrococcus luteus]
MTSRGDRSRERARSCAPPRRPGRTGRVGPGCIWPPPPPRRAPASMAWAGRGPCGLCWRTVVADRAGATDGTDPDSDFREPECSRYSVLHLTERPVSTERPGGRLAPPGPHRDAGARRPCTSHERKHLP